MSISLSGRRVTSVEMKSLGEKKKDQKAESNIDLKFEISISNTDKKKFKLKSVINIATPDYLTLDVEYSFYFSHATNVTQKLAASKEFSENAMLVAYPFIQQYIENLTFLSGIGALRLPYITEIDTIKPLTD